MAASGRRKSRKHALGKPCAIALFILVAVAFPILVSVPNVKASAYPNSSFPDTWTAIEGAYAALSNASSAGGNVTQANVDQLNLAISNALLAESLSSSNHSQAQALASNASNIALTVQQEMVAAKEEGIRQGQMALLILAVFVAACLAFALLIYRFGPDWIWRGWLRIRRTQTVKVPQEEMADAKANVKRAEKAALKNKPDNGDADKNNDKEALGKDEEFTFTLETISLIVAVVLVVIAGVALSQYYLSGRTGESFPELGILSPSMTLNNYPNEVVVGATVQLYAYVGNQLGTPAWYSVLVKVGNNSTAVDPMQQPPIARMDVVLLNGQNWTSPVDFTLTQAGLNQRVVFELWSFNSTTGSMDYTKIWDQIWVNVTMPP
jgi:hypothetical protein